MFETLFGLGFALMALAVLGAVAIVLFKLACAVLWLPFKVAGLLFSAVGALVGALLCVVLLPFAAVGLLVGAVFSILLNPVFLLLVIAVLAWSLHVQHRRNEPRQLPPAMHQA